MDGSALVTETNAFLAWFNEWGNVIYAFTNLVYWIALAFAAVFAVIQLKRFVDHKVGKTAQPDASADTGTVSVEDFVD